jgi:hypothetical protein
MFAKWAGRPHSPDRSAGLVVVRQSRGVPDDGVDEEPVQLAYSSMNTLPTLVAAALRGGTDPDLLEEVAWWQIDDFWQYALSATVAYIRAANRAGAPVRQACQDLAQHQHHPAP